MNISSAVLPRSAALFVSVVLWLLAFVFSLAPPGVSAECFLVAFSLLVFSALFSLAGAEVVNPRALLRSKAAALFIAFWAVMMASVAFSDVRFVSFIYFCAFSVFPLGFLLCLNWEVRQWRIFAVAAGAIMAVLGGCAIVQFFFLPGWLYNSYVAWPLANPNSLAALFVTGFFCAVGAMLGASSRGVSNLALLAAVILGAALFTTGSRGAFFSAVLVLPMLLFFARGFTRRHWRCVLALCVGAPLLFALLYGVSGTVVPDPVAEITRVKAVTAATDWGQRKALWDSTWAIIAAHPWMGTGIGTFYLYYPEVRGADFGTAGLMAHFEPLQFWAEAGIAAPILFYALMGVVFFGTMRALFVLPKAHPRRLKILIPFSAMAAMAIHAHVSYNFHVLPLLMAAGPLLGVWLVNVRKARALAPAVADEGAFWQGWGRYALGAPPVLVLALFGPWQASEITMNRAEAKLAAGDADSYYEGINRAGRLSGDMNARALAAAAGVPTGILQLNAPFMAEDEREALFAQGMELLARAEAQNPRMARIYYERAELVSYAAPFLKVKPGVTQGGELEKAVKTDPLFLPARMKLASILARKGEKARAYEVMKAGLEWPYRPGVADEYYRQMTAMAQEQGDAGTLGRIAEIMILKEMRRRQEAVERAELSTGGLTE